MAITVSERWRVVGGGTNWGNEDSLAEAMQLAVRLSKVEPGLSDDNIHVQQIIQTVSSHSLAECMAKASAEADGQVS